MDEWTRVGLIFESAVVAVAGTRDIVVVAAVAVHAVQVGGVGIVVVWSGIQLDVFFPK